MNKEVLCEKVGFFLLKFLLLLGDYGGAFCDSRCFEKSPRPTYPPIHPYIEAT